MKKEKKKMFKKILYPTDFSSCAEKALGYVEQLKAIGTEEIVILHVIDKRSVIYGLNVEFAELEKLEKESKRKLNELKKRLESKRLKVKSILVKGIPFVEINKIAEKENVSLVVIGSHGKSMVAEMLLGSTSEKVTRKCSKPVLIVKR